VNRWCLPKLLVAWPTPHRSSKQGLRFRREAFSRLSPGTGNRPVPG